MSSVAITGANSFIGKALCNDFLSRGWDVYAIVRKNSMQLPKECIQIVCCMSGYNNLDKLLPGVCDVGILLAWAGTRGTDRDNELIQKENYRCSMQCAEALLNAGCKTLVLAGSQAEYGPQQSENKTSETTPMMPNTQYGIEKKHLYEDASALCKNNDARLIEVRFFSVYGAGDFEGTMISSSLKKMLRNEPCDFTQSIQMWDFLYVTDAAAMTADLIEKNAPSGAYNIGSGDSRPLRSYIEQMKEITRSTSQLNFGAIPYYKNTVLHVQPDMKKTFDTIGKRKLISFDDGIGSILKDGIY